MTTRKPKVSASALRRRNTGPSQREVQKARTREKIVDAAIAVFQKRGYRAASVNDIATRAGTDRTTFYLHFSGKPDLVRAMIERVRPKAIEMYQHLGKAEPDDPAAVRQWMNEVQQIHAHHFATISVFVEAMSSEPELAVDYMDFANSVIAAMQSDVQYADARQRERVRVRLLLVYLLLDRYFYFTVIRQLDLGGTLAWTELSRLIAPLLVPKP